jgi:hypothetical protein
VLRTGATALCISLVAAAGASAAPVPITVTPSSGHNGTRFVVSFLAPRAEPVRGYHVALRAVKTHGGGCVSAINFYNPKAVTAGLRLKFVFKAAAANQLCAGAWKVSVHAASSGTTVLSGGRFTLS